MFTRLAKKGYDATARIPSLRRLGSNPPSTAAADKKIVLVLGVANRKSIAWACVEDFLSTNQFDCIITNQDRFQRQVERLVIQKNAKGSVSGEDKQARGAIVGQFSCDVQRDLPDLFARSIPNLIGDRKLDAIVHSVAYGDLKETMSRTSWQAYAEAQRISSYSLIETARCALDHDLLHTDGSSSLTTFSYLGSVRASAQYGIMGPAKASLEAVVRGLAVELGHTHKLRVNAVSPGPLATLSARSGIPKFGRMLQENAATSSLRRNVEASEVAATVRFLATEGTGITGQTIYVDAGYSSVLVTPTDEEDLPDESQ